MGSSAKQVSAARSMRFSVVYVAVAILAVVAYSSEVDSPSAIVDEDFNSHSMYNQYSKLYSQNLADQAEVGSLYSQQLEFYEDLLKPLPEDDFVQKGESVAEAKEKLEAAEAKASEEVHTYEDKHRADKKKKLKDEVKKEVKKAGKKAANGKGIKKQMKAMKHKLEKQDKKEAQKEKAAAKEAGKIAGKALKAAAKKVKKEKKKAKKEKKKEEKKAKKKAKKE